MLTLLYFLKFCLKIMFLFFIFGSEFSFRSCCVSVLDWSLMIDWRKNSLNPEGVSSVFAFVCACPSVRTWATGNTLWHRNLFFGLNYTWDMRKKRFFFEILFLTLFICTFRFFSLYNTSMFFVFKLPVIVCHVGIWYLGWENLVP